MLLIGRRKSTASGKNPSSGFRGQGATEYLVVLGVVLVVALTSISLLSYFPGTAGQSKDAASRIYWQGDAHPFKIVESKTLEQGERGCRQYPGGYQLTLENAGIDRNTITGITLNGQDAAFCLKEAAGRATSIDFDNSEVKTLELGLANQEYSAGKNVELALTIIYNSQYTLDLKQRGEKPLVFVATSTSSGCFSTRGEACYSGADCCSPDVCNPATLTCVACKQTGEACGSYTGDRCCSGYCVQGFCTTQCGNLNEPCAEGSCCSGAPYCVDYPSQCKAGNLGDRCVYNDDCQSGYCGRGVCTNGASTACNSNDQCSPATPYCVNGNCSAACATEGQTCFGYGNPCCSSAPYCVQDACSSVPGTEGQRCSRNASNCGPAAPICNYNNVCTASTCVLSGDCPPSAPYCIGHLSLSCSPTCAQPGEYCSDSNSCCGGTECRYMSGLWYSLCRPGTVGDACGTWGPNCAEGFSCVNSVCSASCGSAGQKCTKSSDCCDAAPYCTGLSFYDKSCSSGTGTPCDSNADCAYPTPYCDMKIGRCSVCISMNSKTCSDTSQCCPGFGLSCNVNTGVCS